MTLHEQMTIRTVKSVIDAGPYPYKCTWEDYQRAVEDWTWKLRQAVAPDSLCPKCEHRDDCVINTNPYDVDFCASHNSLNGRVKDEV